MVLREIVEDYLNDRYKDGIVTLYINSKTRGYTIGSLDIEDDINNELVETLHLAAGLGNDFVVTIFPNQLDDSLKLIHDLESLEHEDNEDIMLTIPTFKSIQETGGSILVLIFSTMFSGVLLYAFDNLKTIQGSVMLETHHGIQITH